MSIRNNLNVKFVSLLFSVSVPRSSLHSPYRFKPHRRASFDPTDAVSLSSHCLAGWESSKPTVIPMPSSLDLRTSLHKSRTTLVSDTLMEKFYNCEVWSMIFNYMYKWGVHAHSISMQSSGTCSSIVNRLLKHWQKRRMSFIFVTFIWPCSLTWKSIHWDVNELVMSYDVKFRKNCFIQ